MDPEKLSAFRKELGYSGIELHEWIEDERIKMRDERAQERDATKAATELELCRLAKEQEVLQLKLQLQGDIASTESVAASLPTDSEDDRDRFRPNKLTPPFNDKRGDLDAYIQRFERATMGQFWPQEKWALASS